MKAKTNSAPQTPYEKMMKRRRIAGYVLSVALMLVLSILSAKLRLEFSGGWEIVAGIAFLVIALGLLFNTVFGSRFLKKTQKKAQNVEQMQAFLTSHREQAQQTAEQKKALLRLIRIATDLYAVLLFASGVVLSLSVFKTDAFDFYLLAPLGICAAFSQIPARRRFDPKASDRFLDPAEYPRLYATANRAKERMGCVGKIYLELDAGPGSAAGIASVRDGFWILLSPQMLNVWTEEELYTIFLHEFSHETPEKAAYHSARDYGLQMADERSARSGFVWIYFTYLDQKYQYEAFLYEFAVTLSEEESADAAMKESPVAAACALLKLKYQELYEWEDFAEETEPVYAPKQVPEHLCSQEADRFRAAIAERREAWNEISVSEIQARSATHPTVCARIRNLGISELPTEISFPDGAYGDECRKALSATDEWSLKQFKEGYDEARRQNYLEPRKKVEAWEQAGKPLKAEEYPDILNALTALRRFSEMCELAERAIAELPLSASHYGYYYRGVYRLHRYDKRGLDDLYTALGENGNYVESALDLIGRFCCFVGLQEELDTYREKAAGLYQKYLDEDVAIRGLNKKSRLSAEHLPDGMLTEIVGYIVSVSQGSVEKIYLVRNTVSETFFTSPFVIRFKPGTAEDVIEKVMHQIFLHLDTCSSWQFSLYRYDELEKGTVERVPGSCVWTCKSESEG